MVAVSNVRTKGEGITLLSVFFCRIFLQCDHTVGFRWAADAVILYEKDKLPLSVSTLILLIVTITYKMVLVVLGLAVLVIRPPVVMHYLNPILFWCYLGIILNVICVWVMLALVFHPDWMHRMVAAMIDLVTRIFIGNGD